jgi:hypothetical protein
MPNPENIIPPKKGEIRNPNGKPKGRLNDATIFKKYASIMQKAENGLTGEIEDLDQAEQVVIAHILEAKKGNIQAIEKLYDRLYGKVPDRIIDETTTKTLVMIVTDKDIDDPPEDE